jgi:hypothetical protein
MKRGRLNSQDLAKLAVALGHVSAAIAGYRALVASVQATITELEIVRGAMAEAKATSVMSADSRDVLNAVIADWGP